MRTSLSSDRDDIIFREMKVLIKRTFISILIDDYAWLYGNDNYIFLHHPFLLSFHIV